MPPDVMSFSYEGRNVSKPVQITNLPAFIYLFGGIGLISLINVFGNILVIITFIKHDFLRTPANMFIIGLATSDLGQALTYPVYRISHVNNMEIRIKLGNWPVCNWIFIALTTTQICSSYNLLAITVTRYLAIVRPLHYRSYITRRVAAFNVVLIWVASFCTAFLLFHHDKPDNYNNECKCENIMGLKRILLSFVVLLVFPLVIMSGLYIKIARIAHNHVKERKLDCTSTITCKGKEWKATIMVAFLLGFFAVAWIPTFIYFFVVYYCRECSPSPFLSATVRFILFSNSAVNVFIYSLRLRSFQKAVKADFQWIRSICTGD